MPAESTLQERLRAEVPVELGDHEIACVNVGLVREAASALEQAGRVVEAATNYRDAHGTYLYKQGLGRPGVSLHRLKRASEEAYDNLLAALAGEEK